MALDIYASYWEMLVNSAPTIVLAIFTLLIGWILGHALGFIVSRMMGKIGLDELIKKSIFGKFIERSGLTTVTFFDLLVRWIIYLIAALVALDLVNIRILHDFAGYVINYLPSFIGGILVLVLGFVIVDYTVELIKGTAKTLNLKFVTFAMLMVKLLFYFVVIVMSLSIMQVDVEILYIFANAIAIGTALGIGAGLGIAVGWGLKDIFAKKAELIIHEVVQSLDEANDTLEVSDLKRKVEELEKKLREKDTEIKDLHTVRMELIEELSTPSEDIQVKLEELVDGKGTVTAVSNGHKIVVVDPMIFPWFEVMVVLRANNYDVWVTSEKENLVIKSKISSE